ncbi:hypothetical protein COL922a_013296, partial [Colletotrichum nupharicola]
SNFGSGTIIVCVGVESFEVYPRRLGKNDEFCWGSGLLNDGPLSNPAELVKGFHPPLLVDLIIMVSFIDQH